MNKEAILHIPMSEYAFGIDETHITLRLRAKRDDIVDCKVYYGDRACRQTPVIFTEEKMSIVAQTEYHDYFEVTLENPYKRLCYYFRLFDGKEEILYYGDQFCQEPVDDRSEYFQLPFNHRADIVTPPEWAQDAIIYNIFPDSFATSKRHISCQPSSVIYAGEKVKGKLGGTLRGIIENVDYLADLGVNAIYINPIFTAGEYHKYDLMDYYHIDPVFGTNDDFRELVETYHRNGIKVIVDGVFNHCGWKFFAFEDVVKNGEKSRYKDWFYRLQFPVIRPDNWEDYPNYECFGYERMMPKLNTANPEVIDYFCKVGEYWVKEFNTDGWRLDVASEIDDYFWREFHRAVKAVNPQAIMIGEVWETSNHWLDGKIFDSAMNYDFRKHCKRFFAEKTIDAEAFDGRVTNMRMRYRKQTVYAQLNVLDSHDVSRFLSVCNEDKDLHQLSVVFQMCFMGMPSIFYGDEMGMAGVLEEEYRHPTPWDEIDKDAEKQNYMNFYKELIRIRKDEIALRRGDYKTLTAEKGSMLYGFRRSIENQEIDVYLNLGGASSIDVGTGTVLYSKNLSNDVLGQNGFAIIKK